MKKILLTTILLSAILVCNGQYLITCDYSTKYKRDEKTKELIGDGEINKIPAIFVIDTTNKNINMALGNIPSGTDMKIEKIKNLDGYLILVTDLFEISLFEEAKLLTMNSPKFNIYVTFNVKNWAHIPSK